MSLFRVMLPVPFHFYFWQDFTCILHKKTSQFLANTLKITKNVDK